MKKCVRIAALLGTVVLLAALLIPLAMPAGAITAEEVEELRQQATSLDEKLKQLREELKKLEANRSAALEKKRVIENQINVLQQQINTQQKVIDHYEGLIAQTREELDDAKEREKQQYELFCARVRDMEERGTVSYWSVLFKAGSFSDLLGRLSDISEVMSYDQSVVRDLKALQASISQKQAALEATLKEQEATKKALLAQKAELNRQENQVQQLLTEISSNVEQTRRMESQMEAAAADMDRRVAAAEAQYRKEMASRGVVSESGFIWPLDPSLNKISSLFGGRIHPITGQPGSHTGIDIPAAQDTHILAAKTGMVITSGWDNSYGNYVVISHSDGTSTLYAHMHKRGVSEGEVVLQGQVIGYVGTTGSSTGNHLHYEIRVNGVRQDPVNFYPGMVLYVYHNGTPVLLPH